MLAQGHGRRPSRSAQRIRALGRATLLSSACALALAPSSLGEPSGGVVVGGSATISGQGSPDTTIDQSSQRAIINWDDFSVAADESVAFNQPNADAITLNRVVGEDPSAIFGRVSANGRIVLVNPNGVLFGKGARIDVGGLIATTHDIADDRFMAGDFTFDRSSGPNASIVNEGLITVADAGLAAFVAPHVRNSGVIAARLGTVELGAATKFTVDFYGDDLITFPIDAEILSAPTGAEALVVNDGAIAAEGGAILMTASAARGVIDDVILANGEIAASSFTREGGAIVLHGGGAGDVHVAGSLDASGTSGGAITIDGERVFADGSIAATGRGAGGAIGVAGDWVSVGGVLDASGDAGGAVDIAAGGLSLAGDIRAAGGGGAGGAVSIGVAGQSVELASASIDVSGASGGTIRNTAGEQITTSARYDASGSSGDGGAIDVSAPALKLLSASLDASGASGGRVRLGGEFQGGAALATDELPNAALLAASTGTEINVSAHAVGGAGGEAIVWSDVETAFLGLINARPGAGGAGGFIEVSSKGALSFNGDLQTGGGQVLLDPKTIVVVDDSFNQLALILGYNYANVPCANGSCTGDLTGEIATQELFGNAVALDGRRLAVGANFGDEATGKVFLFSFTDEAYTAPVLEGIIGDGYTGGKNISVNLANGNLSQQLLGDEFGVSVSIDGNRLAVGKLRGNWAGQTNAGGGGVYLFTFSDEVFSGGALSGFIGSGADPTGGTVNYLNAGFSATARFGASVSLDGDRLAVGATDIGGVSCGNNCGAVYLFKFADGATFNGGALQATIGDGLSLGVPNIAMPNLGGNDRFGMSVALDGARLAAGTRMDGGLNNATPGAGAVYLFTFADDQAFTGGALQGIIGAGYNGANDINPLDLEAGDQFGWGLSLDNGVLAVGAHRGDGFNNAALDSGEVHLFVFPNADFSGGVQTGRIGYGHVGFGDIDVSPWIQAGDLFGTSVSLDGFRMAIGANSDDGAGNASVNSGAVYLFNSGGYDDPSTMLFTTNPLGTSFITASSLLALLDGGQAVTLQANTDISITTDLIVDAAGNGGGLFLWAGRSILLDGSIDTDGGDFEAHANAGTANGVVDAARDAGAAEITMAAGTSIDAGGGAARFVIHDGAGQTNAASGDITLASVTAGLIEVANRGLDAMSDVILHSGAVLTSSGPGRSTDVVVANGTFTNNAGAGAFAFTGGGFFGVWADHPDTALEGVAGYAKRYNLADEAAYDTAALAAGGNFFGYRIAPVLTVTADPGQTKVYGDGDPAQLTYGVGGLIDGDQGIDALAGALTRAPGENAGSYLIDQGSLAALLGYTISYTGADFVITPRPITVTADPQSKVYGDADISPFTYAVTTGNLVAGDAFSGALARVGGENAGTYAINQGTLTAGANYTLTYVGDLLTITPRPITVTADPQTKVYGEGDPALTHVITSGNLVFNDSLSGALDRAAGENAGSYAINQGTLTAGGNYALTYVGDQLAITPRPITVTADPQTKVYGDADPTLTYIVTSGNLVFNDAFSGVLTRDAGENVNPYAINQGSLTAGANYALTFVGDQLTITPRPITVTANPQTKVYGDGDPALTYAVTSGNLVFNDTFSGALTRAAGETVGFYCICQGTLGLGGNYTLTFVGDQLQITPRPITVTADPQAKIYGDPDPLLTYAITSGSLAFNDTLSGGLVRDPGENVGLYAITQGTLAAGGNYTLTFVGDQLDIAARGITVTADSLDKTYGDPDPALTYTITSGQLAAGDTLTGALVRAPGEDAGGYTISQGTLTLDANYAFVFVDGALTIAPAPLLITPDDATREYGDPNPALTASYSGFRLGDDPSVVSGLVLATPATPSSSVGTYDILASGATAGNYVISYANPGVLTVSPAPLVVTVDDAFKLHGEPNPAFSATYSGLKLGDDASVVSGLTFATGAHTGSPPGAYAVTSSGGVAMNYVIVQRTDGTLTITPDPSKVGVVVQVQSEMSAGQPRGDLGDATPSDAATLAFANAADGLVDEEDEDAVNRLCALGEDDECPLGANGAE